MTTDTDTKTKPTRKLLKIERLEPYLKFPSGLSLKQAKQNGNKTINGLKMLLYQAQNSFFLWFKKKPKITKELENKIKEKIK